jgi:hypothetical protein
MSWMKPELQAAILVPSLKIVPAIPAGAVAQNVINSRHNCQTQCQYVTVHEAYFFLPRVGRW